MSKPNELLFCNALLRETIKDAEALGISIPKLTVYKYPGFSRNGYHTYQVYAETIVNGKRVLKILGDFSGYYASSAKVDAINSKYLNQAA